MSETISGLDLRKGESRELSLDEWNSHSHTEGEYATSENLGAFLWEQLDSQYR